MAICSASIILVPNGCKSIHQEDHDCENRKRKLGEAQAAVDWRLLSLVLTIVLG
jgi:hypothetical protein